MSSDLLAEFDSFYSAPQKNNPTPTPASNDLLSLSGATGFNSTSSQWQGTSSQPANDIWGVASTQPPSTTVHQKPQQNDIWGSFEAFGSPKPAQHLPEAKKKAIDAPKSNLNQTRTGVVRRPTLDLFSSASHFDDSSISQKPQQPTYQRPQPKRESSSGGEILFDAADELEDDDDFGDFETVQPPEPHFQTQSNQPLEDLFGSIAMETKSPKRPKDLLSTNLNSNILPYPQAPKSPSFQERNPFADLKIASPTDQVSTAKKDEKLASSTPITAWPTFEPKNPKPAPYEDSPAPIADLDDEWGDFADLPAETTLKGIEADAWAWDTADRVTETTSPMNAAPPPTNIPPPSLLLALFPPLFDLPQTTLFKAVANQPFSLKNRIISDPSSIKFLRAYLLIATVAARVIAGRKLRWKRDNLLSQAMKIGPAAAGGKGGMKLAGVDKSEVTKEDREAADVVRVWKEQLGRLKSAVAIANTSMKDSSSHLVIPEINEVIHVKNQPGAMTAPKQCVICGLKRDERINKVDIEVEDSFGEWWTDYWGHRACRNFWLEHEKNLKQR